MPTSAHNSSSFPWLIVVVIALLALLAFALVRVRARGFFAERRRLREERKLEEQPTQHAGPADGDEEAALYARSYIEWLDKQ